MSLAADLMQERIQQSPTMTVGEVAEYLHVNRSTIWRWIEQGKLPASRLSARCTRIRRRDVETFVDTNTVRID